MIIKNNVFAAKFVMIIYDIVFVFIAVLGFVGFETYTMIAFAYLFLALACIVVLGLLGYLLYGILDKKYYRAEETKIVFYKKDKPIREFNYEEMKNISYTKIWYIFLFEFEAGHLFFYYNDKPYDISMTYKQAIQFQRISKLMIKLH